MRHTGALLLLLAGWPAGAADPQRFEPKKLMVLGDVVVVTAADLDGDGKLDIVAGYTTGVMPNLKRSLAVFWNRDGVFGTAPDLALGLDDVEAFGFDLADIDGQPGDELLLFTPKGVLARSFRGRAAGPPVTLLEQTTAFPRPAPGAMPRLRLVQDVSGPGSHELLVPGPRNLTVYRKQGAPGYVRASDLALDVQAGWSSLDQLRRLDRVRSRSVPNFRISAAYPSIYIADVDGDGLNDLVATLEDRIAIYRQSPGLSFPTAPSMTRDFAVRTPEELKEAGTQASVTVADVDGDGVADLVVRKLVARGLASVTTTTYVFFGRKGGSYPEVPDQILKGEGATGTDVELFDVTGDGRPDLVVPSVNIGIFAIVKILLNRTLSINFQVFPFLPEKRRFADRPAAERELSFKLNLSGAADIQAIDMFGDYNGDRRVDLAFGTGDDELSIFLGGRGTLFADSASAQIPVRAVGRVESVDLDGKGRSDMLLYYPATQGHRGEVMLLKNVGPW
ncbi:MAG TPA: VCBS repeat-containing protein [Myxococcaceae bacterium]|nr:VCBS repeat-containing protein [Myxococcaceae bacterium]